MSIETTLVTSASQFNALRDDWHDLLSRSPSNNIFLTWEWLFPWWQIYGRDAALRLVLAYENNRLCGIAPLYRSAMYLGPARFRTLEFLGARHVASEYLDFIAEGDDYPRIVNALLAALRQDRDWDVLLGFHAPAESPTFQVLPDRAQAYAWAQTCLTESLYVTAPDWKTYVSRLGHSTRRNVRSHRKRAVHDLRAILLDTRAGIRNQLRDLIVLHQTRMRELGFPGSYASPRFVVFHEQVADLFEQRGWGWMFSLRSNGTTIAANYGFQYDGSFYGYSMGFDPGFRSYSIGFVLFSHLLERCINDGLTVDFMGPGQHKELWKPARRVKVSYVLGSSPRSFAAYTMMAAARSFIVRTVKRLVPERAVVRGARLMDSMAARLAAGF